MLAQNFCILSICVALTVARPNSHSFLHDRKYKRALTPDNTCGDIDGGNGKGYFCDPANAWGGACCSQHGYCGNSSDYCGIGCQTGFGTCGQAITFTATAIPVSTVALISFSAASHSTTTSVPTSTSSISTSTSSTIVAASSLPTSSAGSSSPAVQSGCVWVVPESGRSFTETAVYDFRYLDELPTSDLIISNYGIEAGTAPYSQQYSSEQVAVGGGTLQLKVPGGQTSSPIQGAEVQTTVQDILYGSVRTTVLVSEVAGTCHGLFYYKDDNQESDIEILTADFESGIHYTNQANTPGQKSTTATHPLPSNATIVMHEYRLDWLPGQTVYYLDGLQQQVLERNVPDTPGSWLWNNWSNGDSEWSAGPPETDSILHIQKIEMYYNRTSTAGTCSPW
ncbi:hypothetical protein MMC19_007446 [Ptychographa xylographoides]|nr:hypothetical protein [Ptychographa xylographoides]